MEAQQPASQLCDLDDHLLLQCFSHLTPLPDLFNVAAACRVSAASACEFVGCRPRIGDSGADADGAAGC